MHNMLETFICVALLMTTIVALYKPLQFEKEDPVWQCMEYLDKTGALQGANEDTIKSKLVLCGVHVENVVFNSDCEGIKKIYYFSHNQGFAPREITICLREWS